MKAATMFAVRRASQPGLEVARLVASHDCLPGNVQGKQIRISGGLPGPVARPYPSDGVGTGVRRPGSLLATEEPDWTALIRPSASAIIQFMTARVLGAIVWCAA